METKAERRYYIDWLRILAVFMLIPYHSARIFDTLEPFYSKNNELSSVLTWFRTFLDPWGMPLLFVLAGAATWFALRHRTGRQYVQERVKRLLVPFICGLLLIVPPQVYLARLSHDPSYAASYWQFYPSFFEFNPADPMGFSGWFTPAHLWFIAFLFVFALLALPLFLFFKRGTGRRVTSMLAAACEKRGAILLLALPLVFSEVLPQLGDMNFYAYFLVFIFGYLLMSDGRFGSALNRNKSIALGLGLILMTIWFFERFSGMMFPDFSWQSIALAFVHHFNTWCWVIVLLGFGQRYLNSAHSLLLYAGEASYPVYILHQTAIVIIGFCVVQWNASIAAKYVVIASTATITTLAFYDLLVRRTNVIRFLFGMRPVSKKSAPHVMGQTL